MCGGDPESCCVALDVPGGTFNLDGNPAEVTTVSPFRLDKYEVTVARFRRFVDAGFGLQANPPAEGAGANPHISGSGWKSQWNSRLPLSKTEISIAQRCQGAVTGHTWTDAPGSNDDRWYEAFAFCVWDRGRLPTLAEWNFAALGGDEERTYPWSATMTEDQVDSSFASYACQGDGDPACSLTDLLAVGSKPKGNARWGHADMAGNVYEWTLDGYSFSRPGVCNDCANLDEGPGRVARGGSFIMEAREISSRVSYYSVSQQRSPEAGFRCARED
jgi:formylglycine-generating enzyme required for sulfatase activity